MLRLEWVRLDRNRDGEIKCQIELSKIIAGEAEGGHLNDGAIY